MRFYSGNSYVVIMTLCNAIYLKNYVSMRMEEKFYCNKDAVTKFQENLNVREKKYLLLKRSSPYQKYLLKCLRYIICKGELKYNCQFTTVSDKIIN